MQVVQVYFRTPMSTYSEKRSHFKLFKSILQVKEPSINFCANYVAMCAKHFSFYLTSCNLKRCQLLSLLHRQRALLHHQAYHFLIVEEEFRIRRRNQRWAMFMFLSQMNQQNEQRRRRRAWLRPRQQNWFLNLLANPALNFL